MSIAKVTLDGVSQLDLTGVTVESNNLLTGVTAHNAAGESITGAARGNKINQFLDRTLSGAYVNNDIIKIGDYAFYGTKITSLHAEKVTEIGEYACYQVTTLTGEVYLPNVTIIKGQAFRGYGGAINVTSYYLPKLTTLLNGRNFENNTSITCICLPSISSIENQTMFGSCTALQIADIGENLTGLGTTMFYNCSSLNTIILRRKTSIVANGNNSIGTGTQFSIDGGTGGTVYIPQVLYNHLGDGTNLDYINSTGWSTYDTAGTITWAKIEGSYYETHYADGTLISA